MSLAAPGTLDPVEASPDPGGRLRDVPAYLWCLLAGIVSLLVNKNSQYLHLPVSPDRLFIPLAILLLLLDGRRPRLVWHPVHTLIALLSAWTVVSMAWHGNLFDSVAVFALADRMVLPLVLFALAPLFTARVAYRDLLLKTLTLIGVYLGLCGILEFVAPSLVVPSYIVNPDLGVMFGRARGPFLSGDGMGVSAAVCGFCGLLLASRTRGPWRYVGTLALSTGLITTALSLTRATWVGAAAGALIGGLLVPALRRWIPVAFAGAAALGAATLAALPELQERFTARLGESGAVDDRLGSNDAALSLLRDLPWTGIGWQRFFPDGSEWFRISDAYPMNNVVVEIHNVPLARAAELGIPALLVFLAIWVLGPGRMLLARPQGDLAGWRALGAACFTTWAVTGLANPMAVPFANSVPWLIAGVCATWTVTDAPRRVRTPPGDPSPLPRPAAAPTGTR